jgi:hypothetical protein
MRFSELRHRAVIVLAALLAVAALPAAADPVFGPETYQRTTGPADTYSDVFTAPASGLYSMWVWNGDGSGNRVSSGQIDIVTGAGSRTYLTNPDFSKNVAFLVKAVALTQGSNTINVSLTSEPGSFITVVIVRGLERPDFTAGRLILPYATASNLVIDLKNGAHHPRNYRIVFYDASGNAVASSARLVLPKRGAMTDTAANIISGGSGAWTEGSVEVFYAGRGPARLFGQASVQDATSAVSSIVPLQQAGHRRIDPFRLTDNND